MKNNSRIGWGWDFKSHPVISLKVRNRLEAALLAQKRELDE